ncbi:MULTISPECIES: helix-turn-helix domain-containing protein [Enterobacterales]|uniref:Helix-turn-helix domain-containing protein n=1 Tax=Enterobacter agglomerans TaxID=549 RepID=A0AAN2FGM2_ENTAG|nr:MULTISPECIES: helix-turn-helix domain-containing protein [Enterobacterales]QNQ18679.1 helix-turn-helix domain-containing protein [Kosakonia sp. SMBL-WEM22]CAH6337728.1 Helix-turn-helix domain-containing protein [Pantoea agglomerans]
MAKGTKPRSTLPAKPLPAPPVIKVENLMANLNLGTGELRDYTITQKPGHTTITATTTDGQHVRVEKYNGNNGFSEGSMSVFVPGSIEERRDEARRLRDTGLSQTAIADRLGVSQKTISNDLTK